jgi:hypothetical protein
MVNGARPETVTRGYRDRPLCLWYDKQFPRSTLKCNT